MFAKSLVKIEDDLKKTEKNLTTIETSRKKMKREVDHFYTKTIEIFAVFIAIFSLIVVNIGTIFTNLPDNPLDLACFLILVGSFLTIIIIVLLAFTNWLILDNEQTEE